VPPPPEARRDPFRLVGQTLELRFRVDAEVAEGGFGVVYRAYQIALDRPVALKVLKVPTELSAEERAQFQRNFAAEARTIGRLRHPNIVEVFDFGVTAVSGGSPVLWMALEWLDGQTLEALLDKRRGRPGMTPSQALAFIRPALECVAYAHSQRVVHRDLKPGNVMATMIHGKPFLKVLDFGISKILSVAEPSRAGTTNRTSSAAPAFSPAYAAPEQIAFGRTGPWTDVHALGLIITELLTNQTPYSRPDHEIFEQILALERPTPSSKGIDVGKWAPILAKAMAHSPRERFQTAGDLLVALEKALSVARPAIVSGSLPPVGDRTVVVEAGMVIQEGPLPAKSPAPAQTMVIRSRVLARATAMMPAIVRDTTKKVSALLRQVVARGLSRPQHPRGVGRRIDELLSKGLRLTVQNRALTSLLVGGIALSAALVWRLNSREVALERQPSDLGAAGASDVSKTLGLPAGAVESVPSPISRTIVDELDLTVESFPIGAEVFIDGEPRERTNHQIRVTRAPHKVGLRLNGFEDWNGLWEPGAAPRIFRTLTNRQRPIATRRIKAH
jgi:serine/threonine protein kinase